MKKIILLLIVSLQSVVLFSQNPADVDLAFSYSGNSFEFWVYSTAVQNDGKILVGGGHFNPVINGVSQKHLVRLNTDGSEDTTFNIGTGFNQAVQAIAIQPDGKILVGGIFTTFNGVAQNKLIRLNTDGSKDYSFNIGTGFNAPTFSNCNVNSIAIQPDGKILAAGFFTTFDGSAQRMLIRLNTNGSRDTTFNIGTGFNANIFTIAIQQDGKILVGGGFTTFNGSNQVNLIRLNTNGSKDTAFNIGTGFDGYVRSIAIQPDGKILVGGEFTTFKGVSQNRLIRLNQNGSKDTTFDIGTGFNNQVDAIAVQPDGKILVRGYYHSFNGVSENQIVRLNNDGSKDTTFNIGAGFDNWVYSKTIQPDGKILVGGTFTTFNGESQNRLIRLNIDGSKDTNFSIIGLRATFNSNVNSIAVQSDGKNLVGGDFTTFNGVTQNKLIRLNTDGTKDTAFNIGTGFNSTVYAIAIQPDGKILVGGDFTTFNGLLQRKLIRLNTDGSKDTTFIEFNNNGGSVNTIVVQTDGKILIGGSFYVNVNESSGKIFYRLNDDGSVDSTFNIGTGFNYQVASIAIQTDGKILIGGDFTTFNDLTQKKLIRLNTDGSKDTTFNIGTGFNHRVNTTVIQPDGKILVGGLFKTLNGLTQNRLVRLNSDGSKDSNFDIGTGFNFSTNSDLTIIRAISIQSDGKILVGGTFTTFDDLTQNLLIRLNGDGSKDTTFNIGTGFDDSVNTIAFQSDGKILVGGKFLNYNGVSSGRLIRLQGTTTLSANDFSEEKVTIYPNPVKDIVNINLPQNTSIKSYEIYDLLGKRVAFKNETQNSINVSNLSNGIYLLKIETSEGMITKKLIKE